MNVYKIIAKYEEDENQSIVIVGKFKENNFLDSDSEYYGYVRDYSDIGYRRYPFVMEEYDDKNAILDWGGFDDTKTTLNIFRRRIAVGEKLIRTEQNEPSNYTITEVNQIA